MKVVKRQAYERARQLRREGRSLSSIAAAVGVWKSSVSRWVADIQLDEAKRAALDAANPAAR